MSHITTCDTGIDLVAEFPSTGAFNLQRTSAGKPLLQNWHGHHTYQDVESDHYRCEFGFLPGAWTDAAAESDDYSTAQPAMRHLGAQLAASGPAQTGRPASRGSPLFGTAEAQATIWAHQHPADCSSQRFFLHSPQVGILA